MDGVEYCYVGSASFSCYCGRVVTASMLSLLSHERVDNLYKCYYIQGECYTFIPIYHICGFCVSFCSARNPINCTYLSYLIGRSVNNPNFVLHPIEKQAEVIARAIGPSGSNCDYLFELAHFIRSVSGNDTYLFHLETTVRRMIEIGGKS